MLCVSALNPSVFSIPGVVQDLLGRSSITLFGNSAHDSLALEFDLLYSAVLLKTLVYPPISEMLISEKNKPLWS